MIIFSVDSSSAAGSAALLEDGRIVYEAYANEGLTHSETLLVRCDEVFRRTGKAPSDVDVWAVTSGPGSFTGLRIGMGLVKGLAFPGGKECCPVPTFDALAQAAAGTGRDLLTVLDARQKRAYYAAYRILDGIPVRLCPDGLLPIGELRERCAELGLRSPLVVGDIAEAVCAVLEDGEACPEELRFVHAGQAGRVAARLAAEGKTCSAAELAPFYLQPSQAERNRQTQIQKENER